MQNQHTLNTNITPFLKWFQAEYLRRREKNPLYSIRAFSGFLGISPGTVSHLLSGKRVPSANYVQKLFQKLEIKPNERTEILKSLSAAKNNVLSENKEDFAAIAEESFRVLSDWYHYAILELVSTKEFRLDFNWIAESLDISPTEASQAIRRLMLLDLLQLENGRIIKTNKFVTNEDACLTSSAHKQLQRHLLLKALDAIDNVRAEDKDITSMTMAIDITKIDEAKKIIKKFRRDLSAFLENGNQTQVYNLGIQLYPISKRRNKETI